jgi:hypothetical protein
MRKRSAYNSKCRAFDLLWDKINYYIYNKVNQEVLIKTNQILVNVARRISQSL